MVTCTAFTEVKQNQSVKQVIAKWRFYYTSLDLENKIYTCLTERTHDTIKKIREKSYISLVMMRNLQ